MQLACSIFKHYETGLVGRFPPSASCGCAPLRLCRCAPLGVWAALVFGVTAARVPAQEVETLPPVEVGGIVELPMVEATAEPEVVELPAVSAGAIEELPVVEAGADLPAVDVARPTVDVEPTSPPENPAQGSPGAEETMDTVIVEARRTDAFSSRIESVSRLNPQQVTVLAGVELQRRVQGTLGETLAWEPGVTSAYFSPGASRPVIRGFDGFRVRMMRDELSTMDVSDVSPDHGVPVEPLLAEAIEVHRGPSALLYGNAAIGGAVNTISRTVVRELPLERIKAGLDSRVESVADGWAQTGFASLAEGPFVLQLTGAIRESEDYRIPGQAWTDDYVALENPRVFVPGTGVVPLENPRGRVPNTFHRSDSLSGGLAFLPEGPFWAAISASRHDSTYGLPYIFPGDATDPLGQYEIAMVQERYDLEMGYDFEEGPLQSIQVRVASSQYDHSERFIGLGFNAGERYDDTIIAKEVVEGRVTLFHSGLDDRVDGAIGVHGFAEDLGTSRLVVPPPVGFRIGNSYTTENVGVYALEKLTLGDWELQWGSRWEEQTVVDESLGIFGLPPTAETNSSFSHSLSVTWSREEVLGLKRLAVTGIGSLTERIPTATERYAFWNNAGIGRFLVGGDLDGVPLGLEESAGIELGIEADWEHVRARINGFHYDYENFIFLQEQLGFITRAVAYIEREATIQGWEAEVEIDLLAGGEQSLMLTLMSDYVRGHNDTDNEPLPRMPPMRVGGRLEYQRGPWTFGVEARHSFAQDRVKPAPRAELPTDAYTLVGMDVAYRLGRGRHDATLMLQVSNLLNEEARLHSSFRKDVAPLPGIGVTASVNWRF